VFVGTISLWYGRSGDESSGNFVQEAVFIVARKRSAALAW
jgi:hypothetical protein